MTVRRPTFRFAPSPNGELHLGHALSALVGWQWAERMGGHFLVRIEDIDTGRSREHFVEQIFDDLMWLGITWEQPVLRQSERFGIYKEAAERLKGMGLLYPCFATRKEIAAAHAEGPTTGTDPDGAPLYPGLHKGLSEAELTAHRTSGHPFALRLDMEKAVREASRKLNGAPLTYTAIDPSMTERCVLANPERWGDAIIVRKDVPASYHLAVVVDDAFQAVTHVTRGADLEAATDLHRLLQALLDLPAPVYHHHDLLLDGTGQKFSKSKAAPSLRSLREQGMSRETVLQLASPPKP